VTGQWQEEDYSPQYEKGRAVAQPYEFWLKPFDYKNVYLMLLPEPTRAFFCPQESPSGEGLESGAMCHCMVPGASR
ncbi:TPA: hypothetical protein ACQJUG_005027, partial [Escherichia coli]